MIDFYMISFQTEGYIICKRHSPTALIFAAVNTESPLLRNKKGLLQY